MNKVAVKNAMWTVLHDKYQEKPYHLMLAGGDQVENRRLVAAHPG